MKPSVPEKMGHLKGYFFLNITLYETIQIYSLHFMTSCMFLIKEKHILVHNHPWEYTFTYQYAFLQYWKATLINSSKDKGNYYDGRYLRSLQKFLFDI